MKKAGEGGGKKDRREKITVSLPVELFEKLSDFCREQKVSPDLVVERALLDYFREGDMSH